MPSVFMYETRPKWQPLGKKCSAQQQVHATCHRDKRKKYGGVEAVERLVRCTQSNRHGVCRLPLDMALSKHIFHISLSSVEMGVSSTKIRPKLPIHSFQRQVIWDGGVLFLKVILLLLLFSSSFQVSRMVSPLSNEMQGVEDVGPT